MSKNYKNKDQGKNNNVKRVELLAPAGNYECFEKAIANGADAVYLAGQRFGARAYAGNLSNDEILTALDEAHLRNKKIYLTVNTVFKENELASLHDFLLPFYKNGLDGVIVQDIGAVRYIHELFPDMEIHASTQMSITSSEGVRFLKNMGVTRVVPAREISLDEIRTIIRDTGIEIESFIHGAMCYSYSGKCLFSSYLGERSGNRGRCAQPCRLCYDGVYPLSMKDMYTLKMLPELIDAHIASFKIEGRMKSPEYVACVTGIYRKYIDLFYENRKEFAIDPEDERLILDVYTRSGNCTGYYHKHNGRDMITLKEPGYNGRKESSAAIEEYILRKPESTPVNIYADFTIGSKASLTIECNDEYFTVYGGDVQAAESRPTDRNTIDRQLTKTGGTGFRVKSCDISGDENIFVPIGALNELRRNAFESLRTGLLERYGRNEPVLNDDKPGYRDINKEKFDDFNPKDNACNADNAKDISSTGLCICASCVTSETCRTLFDSDIPMQIVIPASLLFKGSNKTGGYELNDEISSMIDKNASGPDSLKKKIVLRLPYVLRNNTAELAKQTVLTAIDIDAYGIMISNADEVMLLNEMGYKGRMVADEHMYATNTGAYAVLKGSGVESITYPLELNKKELKALDIPGEYLIVYGKAPLMISAQCTKKTLKKCDMKEGFSYLKDRKNIDFPVRNICPECTNIIYNSVPTYLEPGSDIIKEIKPACLRLDFTDEDTQTVRNVLDHYVGKREKTVIKFTRAHFVKGVE